MDPDANIGTYVAICLSFFSDLDSVSNMFKFVTWNLS